MITLVQHIIARAAAVGVAAVVHSIGQVAHIQTAGEIIDFQTIGKVAHVHAAGVVALVHKQVGRGSGIQTLQRQLIVVFLRDGAQFLLE